MQRRVRVSVKMSARMEVSARASEGECEDEFKGGSECKGE